MKKLDREKLGMTKFWKEFRIAARNKEKVLIVTHKKEIKELQNDLKILLKNTIKEQGVNAVVGLTPKDIKILIEVMKLIAVLAFIAVIGYAISKKYKFKVRRDKDGNIEMEGEPS